MKIQPRIFFFLAFCLMAIVIWVAIRSGNWQNPTRTQVFKHTEDSGYGSGKKEAIPVPVADLPSNANPVAAEASVVEPHGKDAVVHVEEPVAPSPGLGVPLQDSGSAADSRSDMADIAALLSQKLDLSDPKKRAEVVGEVQRLERIQMEAMRRKAERLGIPLVIHEPGGNRIVLAGFDGDRPRYYADENVNAAISIGTNLVRSTAPFNVTGSGLKLGLWEASGVPRTSHIELGVSRVTVIDGTVTLSDHATHVAGTLIALGTIPSALGMAPGATIDAYTAGSATSEMLAAGAAVAGEAGKIYISNHSYGLINGWHPASSTWYGLFSDDGNPANDIEDGFGRYDSSSVTLDGLLYNLPYLLPFRSSGNERLDSPPAQGETWHASGTARDYDSAQHPVGDGIYKAGYDLLDNEKGCKNVITIGATNDAVSGGVRNLTNGTLASFSSTGPTDDGRIKPDVVANGVGLYSSVSFSDSSYSSFNGTSMATPNASGSALLLQDYYQQRFPGQALRSSSLKALIIHTADDIGRVGPDYEYGWGLMNTKAAADLIKAEADDLNRQQITEKVLNQGNADTLSFQWDGVSPIRVTLCWTDPAGSASSSHDNRVRDLVNDLNLKVTAPGGGAHLPFVMPYVGNWTNANLAALATTGVNTVDNVEQVLIATPSLPGEYVVTVDHTGGLSSGSQAYSLIISGGTWTGGLQVSPEESLAAEGIRGGPFSPTGKAYTLTNTSTQSLTWSATADQLWVQVQPASGTLAAGAEETVTVSLTGAASSLVAGGHAAEVTFTTSLGEADIQREVTLNVLGGAPQMVVKNTADQNLASGSAISFGSHPLSAGPVDQVFKISNVEGGSTLEVENVMLDGPDAEAFIVVSSPLGAKISSTTQTVPFVVRFSPQKAGVHSAELYLYSNDPAQEVFHLALTATSTAVSGPAQEIVVGSIQPQRSDGGSFTLPAIATSGLPLTYTVLAGPATADGINGVITPTGTGAVTIQLSQSGDGQYAAATPVTVTFVLTDDAFQFSKVSVSGASYHTLAIGLDGRLWSWGVGSQGQLGYGITGTRYVPQMTGLTADWAEVSAGGSHSLAIKTDGSLWAWGLNTAGQVGDGTTTMRTSPVQVASGRWISIATGSSHSVAVKEDGTLWTWGQNTNGQLGDGTPTSRSSPGQVGTATNWQSVAAGSNHTLVIKTDGTLWACGQGTSGQLGSGGNSSSTSLVQVGGSADWKSAVGGGMHSLGIKRNGTLWSWGHNGNGQLGDGTTTARNVPMQVGAGTDWVVVSAATNHSAALRLDGSAWAWGRNFEAQIGNGNLINQLLPVRISQPGEAWRHIVSGPTNGAALRQDGSLIAWGDGSGYGGKNVRQLTRAVDSGDWTSVSLVNTHTLLTRSNGTLWGFGSSSTGQIGNNSSIIQDFGQIGGSANWRSVRTGASNSVGIQLDGSLWVWGGNVNGQIGDGTNTTRFIPVRIAAGTTWLKATLGDSHTLAIRSDGTLWGWGNNGFGHLGLQGTENRTTPVQIGADTGWADLAAGSGHSLFLREDGSLWATGLNTSGQLGLGDTTSRSTLTRVGADNDWEQIVASASTSFAIKEDGSLWGWGSNSSGQLGVGNTISRNTPTRVGTGFDWAQVATSTSWTVALKTDGSIWAWGNNSTYQQGLSIDGSIFSPRQIGNSTGWAAVQAGGVSILAMRADGSLWTAGFSGSFRLTSAGGRSPFALAPVLPALQPQTILSLPAGSSSGRLQASSGLPVELEIISGSGQIQGDHFTHTGAMGSTTVFMAWQRGDETAWNAAIPTQFSITTQSLDFPAIAEQSCGTPLLLNATASSQLPVSYEIIEGAEIASLDGNTITFSAPGMVTIQATQAGSSSYASAEPVSRSFTVVKGSQIIAFGGQVPTLVPYTSSVALEAASDRGLTPVTFSVVSGPGIMDGSQLSFTTAGVVLVQASQVGDEAFLSGSAQLEITAFNTAPVAASGAFMGNEDMTITGAVQAEDAENTPLTYAVVAQPEHGILSLNANGNFSYTPATDFYGEDSFTFKANDSLADSNAATVTLTINAVNDVPVALAQSVTTPDSIPLVITLSGADIEMSDLEFSLLTMPTHGSLSGTAPNLIYTSHQGYSGPDSFTFGVNDGELTATPATVSIQVSPVGITFLNVLSSQNVSETDEVIFEIQVIGSDPITYQWLKDSDPLPNQTSSVLVLSDLTPDDSGLYQVRVTNPVEVVVSEGAELRVIGSKPEIQVQPQHQLALVGEEVVMGVQALGKPPLRYQWRKNGKAIRDATQAELRLPNVQLAAAGAYSVVVTSSESDMSEDAQVGVAENPGEKVFVAEGAQTSWSFKTAGKDLQLAWSHDDGPIPGRMTISSDGKKVSLKESVVADAGLYVCTITGPGGEVQAGMHRLWVVNQAPDITPLQSGDALPPTIVGGDYEFEVPISADEHRVPASFAASGLPPGLVMDPILGIIRGKATASKEIPYSVKITAKNAKGSDVVNVSLLVSPLPSGSLGTFAAPLSRHVFNDELGGRLDLVTTLSGSFSGKLTLGSRKAISFKGGQLSMALEPDSQPTGSLIIPQPNAQSDLELAFTLDPDTNLVEGSLTDGDEMLFFDGWRSTWDTRKNPADAADGLYNLGLEQTDDGPGDGETPGGTGFASVTVSQTGLVKVAGKTADGEAVLGSTFMGPQGQVLVFQTMYKTKLKGSLAGRLEIELGANIIDVQDNTLQGELTWSRPASVGRIYPDGFGPISLGAVGQRYMPPVSPTILLNLLDIHQNAALRFTGGGIELAAINPDTIFQVTTKQKVILPKAGTPANLGKLTLKVNAKTGQITGALALEDPGQPRVIKRKGVFLGLIYTGRSGLKGYGYFLLPQLPENSAQSVNNTPIRSGLMLMEAP